MSGFFDEPPRQARRPAPPPPPRPARSRALVLTAIVLVVAFFMVSVFTGIWTDRLWFSSLGYLSVFNTVIGTRVVLFVVFGLLLGLVVALNIALAYRFKPVFRPASPEQVNLDRYREAVEPIRRWVLLGITAVLVLFAGGSGAGQWRTFLLWRNREPFGTEDPYFNRDAGWFVFELPWLHFLVDFMMAVIVVSIIAAAVTHYLFGGIRLQSKTDKFTSAAQVHLSVLLGLFVLFKAADYWLDRFDLTTTGGGLFTGMSYTDFNAVLPSKNILMFIALICALLFFANVLRRTWMLPAIGLGLLALSALLLGAIWPGIVQQFQVRPSEPDREGPYIARNIEATRDAYDVADSEIQDYDANLTLSPEQLRSDTESIPGIRLLDPALVSSAFEQLQQVRGYYSVPNVLDVDRYEINGQTRDLVVAVRELDQSGLEASQQNWANLHTVYTHGYGLIAAYGNQRNADDEAVIDEEGRPVWAEQDLPPRGELSDTFAPDGYQPRIYFGEQSPLYSIVGKTDGERDVELDIPEGTGSQPTTNTYDGTAGVPVGGIFNKVLYAIKFSEPNIVLSSRVNENSKILYDRTPRERVQKVAPWLTVDGDVYPAVVDGRVVWIVDGYTTTDKFPNSEKDSFDDMTSDALQPNTAYATLPTDEINYLRNSVKAVVDAYDGSVTLYEWEPDPILNAWSKAFPDVVRARSEISDELLAHMRYPEDKFKVQRHILATYHVEDALTFYEGSDRWRVPEDPEDRNAFQPPYRLSVQTPSTDEPVFSLTSVYVPQERQNLASFISVDADAAQEEYGQIRILRLPSNTQVPGPSQIANLFASDQEIQDRLLAFTRTNSTAQFGNLLTLPVGDGLLYVQPLYTLREQGEGRYPVLRYVLVSFGEDVGIGSTLTGALDDVLGITSPEDSIDPETTDPDLGSGPGDGGGEGDGGGDAGAPVSNDVRELLAQAEEKFAEAQTALQNGDLSGYETATNEARDLIEQAVEAAGIAAPQGGGDTGGDAGGADGGADAGGADEGGADGGGNAG